MIFFFFISFIFKIKKSSNIFSNYYLIINVAETTDRVKILSQMRQNCPLVETILHLIFQQIGWNGVGNFQIFLFTTARDKPLVLFKG